MNLNEKQSLIFNHYGLKTQLEKLKEEMLELIEEVNNGKKLCDFDSELADVLNIAEQLKYWAGKDKIKTIQHQKCDRQLERIKNENKNAPGYISKANYEESKAQ